MTLAFAADGPVFAAASPLPAHRRLSLATSPPLTLVCCVYLQRAAFILSVTLCAYISDLALSRFLDFFFVFVLLNRSRSFSRFFPAAVKGASSCLLSSHGTCSVVSPDAATRGLYDLRCEGSDARIQR